MGCLHLGPHLCVQKEEAEVSVTECLAADLC